MRFWTPAFAGVTIWGTFYELISIAGTNTWAINALEAITDGREEFKYR